MRDKGKITAWNDKKGFGFITPLAGGKQVFIHIKAFNNRNRRPELNQLVSYALSKDKQGRLCAAKATLAGDRLLPESKRINNTLPVIGAVLFLVLVGASVVASKLPLQVLVLYLVASLATFIVYAFDKSAARKGGRRTPESNLHLLSLVGGWPGAIVAQQKLRHKSRKPSFRAVFWVTVLLNCGVFVWLFTPGGVATLQLLTALSG